ncbi:tRNA (5-methylaminomethyl-2-thiouridine)(34)-methyltransferase MnmD [Myroides injenensis]|uniref:tRNA (5-methylaminomethyl-2-thiouridine)(34)-methyltransferase MnmD n=1 Tax=Myroides injenensis TaxID=1183151 RepID=UPI0002893DAD|nr:tRNA (5-methylaminomethyl-2-thiouridine)(34)-methyltransferase MnmD [Myroides injenensis]
MKRSIITTSDGTSSLQMDDWGETYHSIHGAAQEANHVYIENGFRRVDSDSITVLEMGFGTGLNTYLTLLEVYKCNKKVKYDTIEAYPLSEEEYSLLNYSTLASVPEVAALFQKLHQVDWGVESHITNDFILRKLNNTFEHQELEPEQYDVIYFDVFGYQYQPQLWSEDIFKKMYYALRPGGVLSTYACRGPIKRNMKSAGFTFEIVPGPPGKREMLVAFK